MHEKKYSNCFIFCIGKVNATLNISAPGKITVNAYYPNPNNGSFILRIDNEISSGDSGGEIIIYNSSGQKVHVQKIIQGANEINTKDFSNGLYYFSVIQNKGQVGSGKLIIE